MSSPIKQISSSDYKEGIKNYSCRPFQVEEQSEYSLKQNFPIAPLFRAGIREYIMNPSGL